MTSQQKNLVITNDAPVFGLRHFLLEAVELHLNSISTIPRDELHVLLASEQKTTNLETNMRRIKEKNETKVGKHETKVRKHEELENPG